MSDGLSDVSEEVYTANLPSATTANGSNANDFFRPSRTNGPRSRSGLARSGLATRPAHGRGSDQNRGRVRNPKGRIRGTRRPERSQTAAKATEQDKNPCETADQAMPDLRIDNPSGTGSSVLTASEDPNLNELLPRGILATIRSTVAQVGTIEGETDKLKTQITELTVKVAELTARLERELSRDRAEAERLMCLNKDCRSQRGYIERLEQAHEKISRKVQALEVELTLCKESTNRSSSEVVDWSIHSGATVRRPFHDRSPSGPPTARTDDPNARALTPCTQGPSRPDRKGKQICYQASVPPMDTSLSAFEPPKSRNTQTASTGSPLPPIQLLPSLSDLMQRDSAITPSKPMCVSETPSRPRVKWPHSSRHLSSLPRYESHAASTYDDLARQSSFGASDPVPSPPYLLPGPSALLRTSGSSPAVLSSEIDEGMLERVGRIRNLPCQPDRGTSFHA